MLHGTEKIISILEKETKHLAPPLIDIIIKEYGCKPFLILVSCLLSLRSKDIVTVHACRTLFKLGQTPQEIIAINIDSLEKIIFKTGLYKNKAKTLHEVSRIIIEKHGGKVPKSQDELLKINGVGRKTANLVLSKAFKIPAICVDTHVHRISNILGLVKTNNVLETEKALGKVIPKKHWINYNKFMVMWGQNICTPLKPNCHKCKLKKFCKYFNTLLKTQVATFEICEK